MRLGPRFGVEVILNDYFLILLGVYFLLGVAPQALLLFLAVSLHELAHVLAGCRCGIKPLAVELLPFGGVARFTAPPSSWWLTTAAIALAGPLSSLILAALAAWIMNLAGDPVRKWLAFFVQVNLMLGFFNLLPALPLDGGYLFRALRLPAVGLGRATREAVRLGQGLALFLALITAVGFYYRVVDLQGCVLAGFLFLKARQEEEVTVYLFWRYFLTGGVKPDKQPRQTLILVANKKLRLSALWRNFVPGRYHLVAVLGDRGKIAGFISEEQLREMILTGNSQASLEELLK
ncbi:MAG: stage sporulation protein [Clostridia bacterium]|nr:stage sporulation protein [Clostridia bacterium]